MSAPVLQLKQGALLVTDRIEPVLIRMWRSEGSYSRIYLGGYGRDGIPCAVKVPKIEIPESVTLARREPELLAPVSSPAVVRLLDRGTHEGVPFLVLEWLDGQTVRELIEERRRLPLRQSLEILERVAEGLSVFHAANIPHGDIRSENVLFRPAGAVIIDPHGYPVGDVPPPSIPNDLLATAGLLYQMLTGTAYRDGSQPLSAAGGHNRQVVALWQALRSGSLGARELLDQVRQLRSGL